MQHKKICVIDIVAYFNQKQLMDKLGLNARPFSVSIHQLAPSSVILQSHGETVCSMHIVNYKNVLNYNKTYKLSYNTKCLSN